MNEIYKKMALVMGEIKSITLKQNNGYFKYRGIHDVYNSLQAILAKHEIFMTCEVVSTEHFFEHRTVERFDKMTKNTKLMEEKITHIFNVYRYKFYTTDGSFVETQTVGEAIDNQDKASNKSMSMAHKYALMQTFLIPTSDLLDADDHPAPRETAPKYKTKSEPKPEPKDLVNGKSVNQWLGDVIKSNDPNISSEKGKFIFLEIKKYAESTGTNLFMYFDGFTNHFTETSELINMINVLSDEYDVKLDQERN